MAREPSRELRIAAGCVAGLVGLLASWGLTHAGAEHAVYEALLLATVAGAMAGGVLGALAAGAICLGGDWLALGSGLGVNGSPVGLAFQSAALMLICGLIVLMRGAVLNARRKAAGVQALREEEAGDHSRRFVDLTPHIAWTADPEGRLTLLPKKLEGLTGAASDDLLNEGWRALVHPDDLAVVDEAWRSALATGEPYQVEFRGLRADGAYIWMRSQAYAARDGSGAITGWYGLSENIDARKQAENDREMLLREVDHRARNILAVLQGVVSMMPRTDPEAFADNFRARLQALAGAHSLLSQSRWSAVELRLLLEQELQPFELDRIHLLGDALLVQPDRVQHLSMIFHELTTNSAKYGCLSRPEGRLRVEWRLVDDKRVLIEWTETGGPAVVAPPVRQGFGSTLIRSIAGRRNGESVMEDWRSDGLCCAIVMADLIACP